jgi:hypothetical protein
MMQNKKSMWKRLGGTFHAVACLRLRRRREWPCKYRECPVSELVIGCLERELEEINIWLLLLLEDLVYNTLEMMTDKRRCAYRWREYDRIRSWMYSLRLSLVSVGSSNKELTGIDCDSYNDNPGRCPLRHTPEVLNAV